MTSTGDGLDDDCDSATDDNVVDDDDDRNKAGSLFRVGISVANCRVVLETLRRTKEQAEKVKEQKEKSRQVAEDGKVKAALEAFGKWCGNGMKLDGESHPVMTRTWPCRLSRY